MKYGYRIFLVTHVDMAGHRHRARITAEGNADAMGQAEREWGDARAMTCLRIQRPALHLVAMTEITFSRRTIYSKEGNAQCA
ncbi:hypothetical protein MCEMSHM24_02719 [Comamonadaceae bacterium]